MVDAVLTTRQACADRLEELAQSLGATQPIAVNVLRDIIAEWRKDMAPPAPRPRTARGNWRFR